MTTCTIMARQWVADEARALLARLDQVQPFVVQQTMIPAAALHPAAQHAIDETLGRARRRLRGELVALLGRSLQQPPDGARAPQLQARLVRARLAFNATLNNLDLFADALAQRSERDTGLWLGGLDAAADDLIALPGYYEAPPVVCYLDRGPGAAIRRARTRLPGGGANPVALIRIPRERMTGTGVAASLAHEVGHQGAALLGLIESLRPVLRAAGDSSGEPVWQLWERWISEIIADFWAVAKLGPAATAGLMGILGLPPVFVFRVTAEDPHPPPWIRVALSCALGHALYPDPQWAQMRQLWQSLYPMAALPASRRDLFDRVIRSLGQFCDLLLEHRPHRLGGTRMCDAVRLDDRSPAALGARARNRSQLRDLGSRATPSLALAVLGQGRWLRAITPAEESHAVSSLFARWAVRRALAWRSTRASA